MTLLNSSWQPTCLRSTSCGFPQAEVYWRAANTKVSRQWRGDVAIRDVCLVSEPLQGLRESHCQLHHPRIYIISVLIFYYQIDRQDQRIVIFYYKGLTSIPRHTEDQSWEKVFSSFHNEYQISLDVLDRPKTINYHRNIISLWFDLNFNVFLTPHFNLTHFRRGLFVVCRLLKL